MTDKNEAIDKAQEAQERAEQHVLSMGKTAVETAQEAVAKAQEAIDKLQTEGKKILESMVTESGKMFDETQKMAGDKVGEMKNRVGEARGKAAETIDNLEQIFEERVSRALSRLGIPTSDDFQAIATRLEELNRNVQLLIERRSKDPKTTEPNLPEREVVSSKDDLQAISGLGPVLESKLNADGITTYRQIAQLSHAEVERIENDIIHSSGRFEREDWLQQAKELHFKKYNEQL